MPVVSKTNRANALEKPEAEFESPEALAEHSALTRAEKLKALKAWEFTVQRRLDSASEGMMPRESTAERAGAEGGHNAGDSTGRDAELLRSIEMGMSKLEKGEDPSHVKD